MSKTFTFFLLLILITGCTRHNLDHWQKEVNQFASMNGFHKEIVQTRLFQLASWEKITSPGHPLVIYIEGDGHAWDSFTKASLNPTPHEITMLKMAVSDPAANVVYLARPCQYVKLVDKCALPNSMKYWTSARFAPEVIESISQAISYFAKQARTNNLYLVGFSGGGAIAVLIAAERNDIKSIVTVAGNLDWHTQSELLHTTPLFNSLDPLSVAYKIRYIPQTHFVGADDQVVPPVIAESYLAKSGDSKYVKVEVIENQGHTSWDKIWPKLRLSVIRPIS